MRILHLCHRIPYPPNKGDKIRAFYQIQAMAEHHEIDLFTLADDPGDMLHRTALLQYCREVTVAPVNPRLARLRSLPYLLTRTPLTIPYFYSAELQRAVSHALATRSYDRIFVYCSAMMQYVEAVDGIPIILDLVDVDSDKWTQYAGITRFPMSAIYRREGKALQAYERKVSEKAAFAVVSTEREGQLMCEISSLARVEAIPNGVDTDHFAPTGAPSDAAPTLIFTGDMSYFPNQDAVIYFAREVLPLIRRSVPPARFLIVGRNPSPSVTELQKLEGVEVTGFVPDIRAQLARAQVAVAPFKITAGIPNKILEAMAYGLPIVATRRATQGLSPTSAELVRQGNTAEELAEQAIVLLRDTTLSQRIGLDGRIRVKEDYTWDGALRQLMHLIENLATEGDYKLKSESSRAASKS